MTDHAKATKKNTRIEKVPKKRDFKLLAQHIPSACVLVFDEERRLELDVACVFSDETPPVVFSDRAGWIAISSK